MGRSDLRQFTPLTDSELELLESALSPVTFKKGENIVSSVKSKETFISLSAEFKCLTSSRRQKPMWLLLRTVRISARFQNHFHFKKPSPYSLVCISDSEMDAISFSELQILFDKSQAIERLFRKMTEAILAGMIARHIELHSLSMRERSLAFCRRSPQLLQMVPHKFIASYLGIDPTNFSKLFNQIRFWPWFIPSSYCLFFRNFGPNGKHSTSKLVG